MYGTLNVQGAENDEVTFTSTAQSGSGEWQGIVIYGCVRDVEILDTIDVGVKALAAFPVRSEKRGEGQLNVAVQFAGVHCAPGNSLYADRNGFVVAEEELPL